MNSTRDTTNSGSAPAPATMTTASKSAPTANIDAINAGAIPPTTDVPLMAGANGSGSSPASATTPTTSTTTTTENNASASKKRKKEALKPIITTEGSAPTA